MNITEGEEERKWLADSITELLSKLFTGTREAKHPTDGNILSTLMLITNGLRLVRFKPGISGWRWSSFPGCEQCQAAILLFTGTSACGGRRMPREPQQEPLETFLMCKFHSFFSHEFLSYEYLSALEMELRHRAVLTAEPVLRSSLPV